MNPAFVTLEHHALACYQVERSNDWIASCYKDLVLSNANALDSLLRSDEALHDFVLVQVYTPDHFVP